MARRALAGVETEPKTLSTEGLAIVLCSKAAGRVCLAQRLLPNAKNCDSVIDLFERSCPLVHHPEAIENFVRWIAARCVFRGLRLRALWYQEAMHHERGTIASGRFGPVRPWLN